MKPKKDELTQERLKKFLHYDPETGVFTWINPTANCIKKGDVAGNLDNRGYLRVCLLYTNYSLHRLAWFYVYGVWPKDQIDHINRIPTDNRICNLREATPAINAQNLSKSKRNSSGCVGVDFMSNKCLWRARIQVNGKRITVGTFHFKEQAIEARRKAALKHGFIGE